MLSGILFAVGIFLFADAVAVGGREILKSDRPDFLYWLPFVFAIIGFGAVSATSPKSVGQPAAADPKEAAFFVIGWCMIFGSTIGALVLCGTSYVGPTNRHSGFPGVAIVVETCIIALAAVAFWVGKGGGQRQEMDSPW